MIDKLRKFIKSAGASSEEESKRDGFLSYGKETHALGEGFYAGFTTSPWHSPKVPDKYDVESHYWKGGYVAGTLTQGGFMILASYGVISSGAFPF